jgi:hypothetical protein
MHSAGLEFLAANNKDLLAQMMAQMMAQLQNSSSGESTAILEMFRPKY